MQLPAQHSPLATPALAFIFLVSIALGYGAVNELIFGTMTIQIVTAIFGLITSVLMLVSAVALWGRATNARKLAIVTAGATLAWCGYALLPGNRVVGYFALLLSVLASAALIWFAQRGIGAGTPTSV